MTELLLILFVLGALFGPWVAVLVLGLWKRTSRKVDRLVSFDTSVDAPEEVVEHFVLWENELRESAK